MSKEIDDPLKTDPPAARSTIRARSPRHPSNLLGFVRDVRALRWVRGQRRPLTYHRPDDDHDEADGRRRHDVRGRRHADEHVRVDDDQHGPPLDADDDRAPDHRDDHATHGPHDRRDRKKGRADDCLFSPDDPAGHDDDGLFVDAVRSGDLLLGPS